MRYRSEIDGLRAVAVVPVIFFHAGFERFAGGFIGVDVFFVLSGYLITSILIEELEQERFSILKFYERRARRILPALFFVTLCCLPFAALWMFPDQLVDFGKSLIAVGLFSSNILFWRQTNYFAPEVEQFPLLHTWSLAVEEQYYILFPVFLVAMWRYRRSTVFLSIVALALISLGLSEWGWRNKPTANFYLAPTRAWELFAGSICAFVLFKRQIRGRDSLAAIGLVLILVSVFAFDSTTPFPSLYALAPVGGTALIVLFGQAGTHTAALLSMRGVVGIGLISYSAYLWHQPLFAFARIRSVYDPEPWLYLLLSVVSLGLAYVSWQFVEAPFRRRPMPALPRRPVLFGASGAGIAACILTGLFLVANTGLPERFGPEVQRYLAARADGNPRQKTCLFTPERGLPIHPVNACMIRVDGRPGIDVAILGDSHADALSFSVQETLRQAGLSSYAITYAGCPTLPGLFRVDEANDHLCNEFVQEAFDYFRQADIRTVVLSARWTLYYQGDPFDNLEGGHEKADHPHADLVEKRPLRAAYDDPARKRRVLDAYTRQLTGLLDTGINIVLVYPIPEAGWPVPETLAKQTLFAGGADAPLSTSYDVFLQRNQDTLSALDKVDHPGLYRVKPHELLCDSLLPGRCLNTLGDSILYHDDNHLSNVGAAFVAPKILRSVERTLRVGTK